MVGEKSAATNENISPVVRSREEAEVVAIRRSDLSLGVIDAVKWILHVGLSTAEKHVAKVDIFDGGCIDNSSQRELVRATCLGSHVKPPPARCCKHQN